MDTVQPTTAELSSEEITRRNREKTEEFWKKWREEKENPTPRKIFFDGVKEDLKRVFRGKMFDFPLPIRWALIFLSFMFIGVILWNQAFLSIASVIDAMIAFTVVVIPSLRSFASQIETAKVAETEAELAVVSVPARRKWIPKMNLIRSVVKYLPFRKPKPQVVMKAA